MVQVTSTTWRSPPLLSSVRSSVRESKVWLSMVNVPAIGRARLPELSMVVVADWPTLRVLEFKALLKRLVVVAFVVVLFPVMMRFESMVEEAVERKPFNNPRVVEVETP